MYTLEDRMKAVSQRAINLIGLLRQTPRDIQLEIYEFLKKKFEGQGYMTEDSAREKIRRFFLDNLGRVVVTREIGRIAGIPSCARRIRELRRDCGLNILNHHDRDDLKPGQYLLLDPNPVQRPDNHGIDSATRARILTRDGYTCQMYGAGAGEPDPLDPSRRVRLQVDHKHPRSEGGPVDDDNLQTLCSVCNEGRRNLMVPPDRQTLNVMETVRLAPRDVQIRVLEFLKRKFETAP